MARLPTPGSDNNKWGVILNDFLLQQHLSNGQHDVKKILSTPSSDGMTLVSNSGANKGIAWQVLDKNTVGLGNVDNTSDADKPLSIATQAALDTKLTGTSDVTDNAVVRFDGTTGKLIQDSSATLTDDGNLTLGSLLKINAPTGNPEFDFQEAGTTRAKMYYDVVNNRFVFQNNESNGADALYFDNHAAFIGNALISGDITVGTNTLKSAANGTNIGIGIGTAIPTSVTPNRLVLHLSDNSGAGIEQRLVSGAVQARFFNNGTNSFGFGTDSNHDIFFYTNGGGNPRLTLFNSGVIQLAGNTRPSTNLAFTLGQASLYWLNTFSQRLTLNDTAYFDGASAGRVNIVADNVAINGSNGATGAFTTVDGKTVTVTKGLVTAIV